MANFFKKKKIVLLLASMMLCFCAVFGVACKKEKVEKISISKSNAPQSVYVLGSELDLSEGILTVVINGKKTEVSLTDPKVVVSGYEKDKLGEQVLTVEYQKQTTVFKVNVVPRMLVQGYEPAYFVGEPINLEKGSVQITADDGKMTSVDLNDSTITVSGYDSTAANEALPLTLTYKNGDVQYESTFDVAIYEVTEVDFKSPNKKAYLNHEKKLDVAGGYIALKCDKLSRYVQLTADMVSGFDLSAATIENRGDNPLTQTLTVSYYGQTKTYDIQIKFSDISLITLRGEEMESLNWTSADLPSDCTETMGENALEAMEVYFGMEEAETTQLPAGAIDHIVKVATAYGLNKWQEAFASYSDAFYLTENGSLNWNCEDFAKTEAAYQNILNRDPVLYEDGAILVQIAEKFATTALFGEDLIGDVLSVMYSPDTIDEFSEQLKLMIDLHKAMKDVPVDWTLDMLKSSYTENIHNAWVLLRETEFKATQQRTLYFLVSRWREKNDYFEILYTYYYDAGEMSKINDFKDLRLPTELETLYSYLLSVRNQIVYIQQMQLMEATNLMVSYEAALEQKEVVLNSGDQMLIDLYNTLEFDYLIGNGEGGYTQCSFDMLFNQFRRMTFGYLYNMNTYLGIDSYEALWADYSEVIQKVAEVENYVDGAEFADDVQRLMRGYWSLTPKQQFAFMCIIHPYYKPSNAGRYPLLAWENDGEGFHSQFVYLVYTYYQTALPETTHEIFTEMMLASESLANLQISALINTFLEHMDNIESIKERVIKRYPDDWETFNDIAGWMLLDLEELYDKFKGLTEEGGTVKMENLTDEELKDFEGLLNASAEAYAMMMTYNAFLQQGKANIAIAFIASMERVEYYANKILASEDPRILRAYAFDEYSLQGFLMPDGQSVNFGGTMDLLVWLLRDTYTDALTGSVYVDQLLIDEYERVGVQSFLADFSYIYYTYIYMNLVPSADENYEYFDVDTMVRLSHDYREKLTDEQRYFLVSLDGNFRMYQNAMIRFAKERNSAMTSLVTQLMQVEYMYTFYVKVPDGEYDGETYGQILKRDYELLLSDYADFQQEADEQAKADFETYFGEMMEFYQTKIEALDLTSNA